MSLPVVRIVTARQPLAAPTAINSSSNFAPYYVGPATVALAGYGTGQYEAFRRLGLLLDPIRPRINTCCADTARSGHAEDGETARSPPDPAPFEPAAVAGSFVLIRVGRYTDSARTRRRDDQQWRSRRCTRPGRSPPRSRPLSDELRRLLLPGFPPPAPPAGRSGPPPPEARGGTTLMRCRRVVVPVAWAVIGDTGAASPPSPLTRRPTTAPETFFTDYVQPDGACSRTDHRQAAASARDRRTRIAARRCVTTARASTGSAL